MRSMRACFSFTLFLLKPTGGKLHGGLPTWGRNTNSLIDLYAFMAYLHVPAGCRSSPTTRSIVSPPWAIPGWQHCVHQAFHVFELRIHHPQWPVASGIAKVVQKIAAVLNRDKSGSGPDSPSLSLCQWPHVAHMSVNPRNNRT